MDMTNLMKALSVGRIAVGLGLTLAPEQVGGQWFGRDASRAPVKVAIRALGIRDLALGAATLGALQSTGSGGKGTRVLTALGVMCDAVDATATFTARDQLPGRGTNTIAIASGAAMVGIAGLANSPDD